MCAHASDSAPFWRPWDDGVLLRRRDALCGREVTVALSQKDVHQLVCRTCRAWSGFVKDYC